MHRFEKSRWAQLARWLAAAGVLVSASALAGGKATPAKRTPLPHLTAEQFKAQVEDMLRRQGDLGAYDIRIEPDGTIYFRHPDKCHECCNVVHNTLVGEYVKDERLENVKRLVEHLDKRLKADPKQTLIVKRMEPDCVTPSPPNQ